jgi:hypothetical protein
MRAVRHMLALAQVVLFASACVHHSPPVDGLCVARTIRSKPFEGSRVVAADLEDLTFEKGTDALWVGDDNSNQIYIVDSETGRYRARLRQRDFTAAFPDAKRCDNGSADVECSYTAEFESLAYDPAKRALYVVNTVNKLKQTPAVDKPALFKLQSPAKGENLKFVEWKALQEGHKYGAIEVVGGVLYVALGAAVYAYDYDENRFVAAEGEEPEPVWVSEYGGIVGMARQGGSVWVLTQDRMLVQVDWKTRQETARHDLTSIGLNMAKGLAYGRSEFFVVEGNHPNPIYVLQLGKASGWGKATFLGGWPRSCPGP